MSHRPKPAVTILATLYEAAPTDPAVLAELTGMGEEDLEGELASLEERGLVEISRVTGTVRTVELTSEGSRRAGLIAEVEKAFAQSRRKTLPKSREVRMMLAATVAIAVGWVVSLAIGLLEGF